MRKQVTKIEYEKLEKPEYERVINMANIKKSITELVGHTPLLELVNYEKKYVKYNELPYYFL